MTGTYKYGRIRALAEQLQRAGVPGATIAQIMEGGEAIGSSTRPEEKAAWMKEAMLRLNRLVDLETRQAVREACACCLGGKRLQISEAIARDHATLDDRIAAANQAHLVFGHSVTRQDDGQILVRFDVEGKPRYRCVCLPKAEGKVPVTYCFCCGGHIKHHLQIALGRALACTVRSSALSSGGTRPCTFLYRLVDQPSA